MFTKVVIYQRLLAKARRLTKVLRNYIRIRKQRKFVELFGTIHFDPKYDYKKQRSRK